MMAYSRDGYSLDTMRKIDTYPSATGNEFIGGMDSIPDALMRVNGSESYRFLCPIGFYTDPEETGNHTLVYPAAPGDKILSYLGDFRDADRIKFVEAFAR